MEFETSKTKLIRVSNAVAVGTTAVNSSIVDMANFDGVRFAVQFGAITDGTPTVKVQQGADSGLSDAADLEGTLVTGAITDDNKMLVVEVYRPRERYVRCVVGRGGATGAVIDSILAEQYGPRVMPVTKDATVAVQEAWGSPAEGTA